MIKITMAILSILVFLPTLSVAESPDLKGIKTALLIIDIQDFYYPGGLAPLVAPEAASENASKILTKFRDQDLPVIHIGHNASKGKDFHVDVKPIEGEKVIFKDEVSAFNGTELDAYLKSLGVNRLVICGMQTHMCLEGATRAAYDLGYTCIVIADACATQDLKYGDAMVKAADVHTATLSTLDHTYAEVIDTEAFLGQ